MNNSARYAILVILLVLFTAMIFVGKLMKIMHWPGASMVNYTGIIGTGVF
ncbi:MAG: hypothetical protein V4635_07620 [Bacteroidota bacterium]